MSQDKCFDDGSSLQALHDQVYGGPGPDVVTSAATSLDGLAPWINGSAQRLRDAFSKTGTEWTGPAAEAATTALNKAAAWAENTSTEIQATSTHVQNYADSFAAMKPKIVPPQPVPSLSTWDVALGVLDPSNADHARAVHNNVNATEIALAAYSTHETHTDESVSSITPPPNAPQITNPTHNLAITPTTGPKAWPTPPKNPTLATNPSGQTATPSTGRRGNRPAAITNDPGSGITDPTNLSVAGLPPVGSSVPGDSTVPSGWTPLPPPRTTGPLTNQAPLPNPSPSPPSPIVVTPSAGIAPNGPARPGPPPRTSRPPHSTLDTAPHRFDPAPAERNLIRPPSTPTETAFPRDFTNPINRPANSQPFLPTTADGAQSDTAGERYRNAERRRTTAKDEDGKPIQLYDNPFAIDEASENLTPPVLGLERPEQ